MMRDRSRRIAVAAVGLLATAALLLASGVPDALAQTSVEPTAFKNVRLWINPEYDDPMALGYPALLVMLEGQIVGAEVPARVRFLVPSTAVMYSAGSKDASGKYTGGPPDRKAASVIGWDEISYELKQPTFRVEYYDSIGNVSDREIAYEFLRLYPVEDLAVIVQEPRGARDFTVSPAGSPLVDGEGFNVQTYRYSALDASTPVEFRISYSRDSSRPSLSSAPAASNTGLVIGLVIVAAVLGGGGVYLFTRSSQRSRPASRAERRRRGAPARQRARPAASAPSFCSQCGRRLDRPSRFCPDCGTDLR